MQTPIIVIIEMTERTIAPTIHDGYKAERQKIF